MDQLKFNDLFSQENLALSVDSNLTIALIVFNMLFAGLIGSLIAWMYRRFFMGVLFQKSFAVTIIGITMVTTLVIMVISGNLILSLGMVGALSIVRFRAAIKDPLDVLYIFWAVGSGIAIAVSQYLVVLVSVITIGAVFGLLSRVSTSKQPKLIVVTSSASAKKRIEDLILKNDKKVLSRSTQMSDGRSEQVFETTNSIDSQYLLEQLSEIDSTVELRLLNYYGNN
tara:strand:+ start:187 stop:864 length:678 start_codon:yes stop_codon:yes gene_type:complete